MMTPETYLAELERMVAEERWCDLARANLMPVLADAGAIGLARELNDLEIRELGERVAPPDPAPWHRLGRMRGDPEHELWCALTCLALEAGDRAAVARIEGMVIRRTAS